MTTPARRLIFNADDFGRSASINHAVIQAHRQGVLTSASLMVNEPHAEQAVTLARQNPALAVGLHLTLLCGRAAHTQTQLPGLVNHLQHFTASPLKAGCAYFFRRSLREQLRTEIRAQLSRFTATGLSLDHVNGHLHIHLHPVVLAILADEAPTFGIRSIRLTRDPFWLNLRLAGGRFPYRATHALIFSCLQVAARKRLRGSGLKHTHHVFGLLQNGAVHESYILNLLPSLPPGDSELYSHPSLDDFKPELDALLSARVRKLMHDLRIQPIRYGDL